MRLPNIDVFLACEYSVGASDRSEKTMSIIKTPLIKIGNSRGIRIPKVLIDQIGLGDEVEIDAQRGQLVIRPIACPRNGGEEQFQAMAGKPVIKGTRLTAEYVLNLPAHGASEADILQEYSGLTREDI
jgi:antitoxin component of MazEF toxin-antitoxin module